MKFIGYHGTDANNIESILKNGYKLSGENEWFGEGIYFFEDLPPLTNGFKEAKDWAVKVKRVESWAVFQAEIETDVYIDLLLDEHKAMFEKIKEELFTKHKALRKDAKSFSDRVVFSMMLRHKEVELIRAAVDAGKPSGYYSPIIKRLQIQICIRKPDCIKNNILYKREDVTHGSRNRNS